MKNNLVFAVFLVLLALFAACQGKSPESSGTTTTQDAKVNPDNAQASPAPEATSGAETADSTKAAVKTEPPKKAEPAPETAPRSSKRELSSGEVGEVVYAAGDVQIARNGTSIDDVSAGSGIENWDLVKTADASSAELELRAAKSAKTTIKVRENTSFTVDLNKLGSRDLTHVDLITGSLTLKVQKLTAGQDLTVSSDSSMMGVRGTTFEVATIPTGDTLVTCNEGSVECLDRETEKKYYAKPGQVVEAAAGGTPKLVNVAVARLQEYTDNWIDEKVRLLKQDALAQIKKYHKLYEKYSADFEKNYTALSSANGILDKWIREDKEGKIGPNIEVMKEKKAVIGHLMKIQKSLFWMERVYFRLKKIKKYHDQGFGVGEIKPGLTTKDFFAALGASDFENKLARVLFVHKLYAKRNGGSTPLDAFMSGLDGGDDFFDKEDDFFDE